MAPSSLVLELQQMASDRDVPVSSLLLKAKMVAVKLGLTEMVAQLDREIAGYSGEMKVADLPEYRWAHGSLKVHNPYNGLCPIVFPDAETERLLSRVFVSNSIHEIEDSLKDEKSVWSVPPRDEQRKWLKKNCDHMGMPILNIVSKTRLLAIVTAVRAAVLDWSLDLEKRGILGEGLTFTAQEKQAAPAAGATIHIGQIGTMQGIIGSVVNSTVAQNLNQSVVTNDRESLKAALREVGVLDSDIGELEKAIDAEPKAKNGKLGEKVGAWVGGMAQKAATGIWKTTKDKALDWVLSAVSAYYGLGSSGEAGAVGRG